MPLIQITADLSRVSKALERIGEALERAFPKPEENQGEPSTEKDLYQINYPQISNSSSDEAWRDYGPRSNYYK